MSQIQQRGEVHSKPIRDLREFEGLGFGPDQNRLAWFIEAVLATGFHAGV